MGESFEEFRALALRMIAAGVEPSRVNLQDAAGTQVSLLDEPLRLPEGPPATVSVPKAFGEAVKYAAAHRSHDRWNVLYRLLWRLAHGERELLARELDDDVRRLKTLVHDVRHDLHKGEAFVRFRKVDSDEGEHFIAWHRSEHRVLPFLAAFFKRRLPGMTWSLLTPDGSAHWDGRELSFGPAVDRSAAPEGDELETLWRRYYATTFNPSRVNERMMKKEMPVKYWGSLPEASLIPQLLHDAGARSSRMISKRDEPSASEAFIPESYDLSSLGVAARACTACPLHERATQTVFGEGVMNASMMLIGEQPGDNEDIAGKPFIGPAGAVLDEALRAACVERESLYVTNAVKHFKWYSGEGKRRIHQRPDRADILACKGWLLAEIELVKPRVIVCLGATAAQSLLGTSFKITVSRGQLFQTPYAQQLVATFHPSAILRADPTHAPGMRRALHDDIALAARALLASS